MAKQTFALRCAKFPKRPVLRPEFDQCDRQLALSHASGVKEAISAILFVLNGATNRIDFSRSPNETLFRTLTES
jgi:hypothetical protein